MLRREVPEEEPCEPVALIAEALRRAGEDSGTGERLLRGADSVRCVPVICWHYRDAAALVAEDLRAQPRETAQSAAIGGDGPQLLLNDTARAIAAGHLDIALLGGGEAVASVRAAELAGRTPSWRQQHERVSPTRTLGEDRPPVNQAETAAGLAPPVFMYALIESAVRAVSGSTPEAHLARIAGLWSRFSEVAAENPYAWIRRAYTSAQIAAPTPENRLVSTPYTKLLTANIQVNMASGLILTSAGAAQQAGVPRDRWVFIHAGAQARDTWHVSERETLTASPAIRASAKAATRHAGVTVDEIAYLDLYSCFPAAVQVAARELGVSLEDRARPLTLTDALTAAPWRRADGATHMDNVTNLNATYPNPDALQEFAVQTSNYSAQYGNFSGAVVNVVTRSGSNQVHGSVFEFLRNGAMNARNVFASQSDNLVPARRAGAQAQQRPRAGACRAQI